MIWHVQAPILRPRTLIRDLLNPPWKVAPLISTVCSYPQYGSHLSPPSLFLVHNSTIITEHKVKSSCSISPCHDHELTPCTAYMEYSIHRVQHTPNTAYTEHSMREVQHSLSTASTHHCLSSLYSHDHELTPECSYSFQCCCLQIDCHQLVLDENSIVM